jgi:hypothetical protein
MLENYEFELDNTSTACGETGYGLENAGPKMKLRGNCAARLHERWSWGWSPFGERDGIMMYQLR